MKRKKHSPRHGIENRRQEREDQKISQHVDDQSLVGLRAKVVSDASPVFRGRVGEIMGITGKVVSLHFKDGRLENHITIHLRGLLIYTMEKTEDGKIGRTIRFK